MGLLEMDWSIPPEIQLAAEMLTAWKRSDKENTGRDYASDPAFRKLALAKIDFIGETLNRQGGNTRMKEVFDLVGQEHPEYARKGYMRRLEMRWERGCHERKNEPNHPSLNSSSLIWQTHWCGGFLLCPRKKILRKSKNKGS
jgi:hypothetical protein